MLSTHTVVPDYFHKNYALACEKMGRLPNITPQQTRNYLLEAIKHFEAYVLTASGMEDEQTPTIQLVLADLKGRVT